MSVIWLNFAKGARSRPDLVSTYEYDSRSLCMTNSSWEKGWIVLELFEWQHTSHEDKMLSYVAGEQRAFGVTTLSPNPIQYVTALYLHLKYLFSFFFKLFKIVQQLLQFTAVACILIPNSLFLLQVFLFFLATSLHQ